ncbi:hypothetical protein HYR99_27695 [Candidatus Poribacteria bacterium]|nr:hypothetical protein [Candidatus Poribacteria bacterium]
MEYKALLKSTFIQSTFRGVLGALLATPIVTVTASVYWIFDSRHGGPETPAVLPPIVITATLFFLIFLVVFVGMEWLSLLRMMWQAQKLRQVLLNPGARQRRVKQLRHYAAELGIQDLLPKEDVVSETDSHEEWDVVWL